MATRRQIDAARSTIKKAQVDSRTKRARSRPELGGERTLGGKRPGEPAAALEFRSSQQLYALASEHRVPGRSKMAKPELIAAIRKLR